MSKLIHGPETPAHDHKIVDRVMNMTCNSRHYKCSCGFVYCEYEQAWRDGLGQIAPHPYKTDD